MAVFPPWRKTRKKVVIDKEEEGIFDLRLRADRLLLSAKFDMAGESPKSRGRLTVFCSLRKTRRRRTAKESYSKSLKYNPYFIPSSNGLIFHVHSSIFFWIDLSFSHMLLGSYLDSWYAHFCALIPLSDRPFKHASKFCFQGINSNYLLDREREFISWPAKRILRHKSFALKLYWGIESNF